MFTGNAFLYFVFESLQQTSVMVPKIMVAMASRMEPIKYPTCFVDQMMPLIIMLLLYLV